MKRDLTGMLDATAAARILGINMPHLYVMVNRGELPTTRVGRTLLFEGTAIRRIARERNQTGHGWKPNPKPKTKVPSAPRTRKPK